MADLALQHRAEAKKRRSLVTPEGVDLSLKLADIGQRIGAFMIDLVIMVGILIGITLARHRHRRQRSASSGPRSPW